MIGNFSDDICVEMLSWMMDEAIYSLETLLSKDFWCVWELATWDVMWLSLPASMICTLLLYVMHPCGLFLDLQNEGVLEIS